MQIIFYSRNYVKTKKRAQMKKKTKQRNKINDDKLNLMNDFNDEKKINENIMNFILFKYLNVFKRVICDKI